MDYIPSDLKIIKHYKKYELRNPVYTSNETQQIYDDHNNILYCDSHNRVLILVFDKNSPIGYSYKYARRSALLKANNDFDKEREAAAPRLRKFDSNHKPFNYEQILIDLATHSY